MILGGFQETLPRSSSIVDMSKSVLPVLITNIAPLSLLWMVLAQSCAQLPLNPLLGALMMDDHSDNSAHAQENA